jgi:TRAP-type uncharacterized transport system fused permease subunit
MSDTPDSQRMPEIVLVTIFWMALVIFQLPTPDGCVQSALSSQVVRAIHVGFVLLLIFALYPPWDEHDAPASHGTCDSAGLAGAASVLSSACTTGWFEADLTQRAGESWTHGRLGDWCDHGGTGI